MSTPYKHALTVVDTQKKDSGPGVICRQALVQSQHETESDVDGTSNLRDCINPTAATLLRGMHVRYHTICIPGPALHTYVGHDSKAWMARTLPTLSCGCW